MTKQLQIGSRGFYCKAVKGLNSLDGKFENEIRRGPWILGLNLCWDGLELCQTVVTSGYILTYDVTLLRTAKTSHHPAVCAISRR